MGLLVPFGFRLLWYLDEMNAQAIRRRVVLLALVALPALVGCEHPCTLRVGHPEWCGALPKDASPFCREVCSACDEGLSVREKGCRATCRTDILLPDRSCESLTEDDMKRYRKCLRESDHYGCGPEIDVTPPYGRAASD